MTLIKKCWPIVILVLLAGFLLFYNLGGDSLKDWDEGIYTQIYKETLAHPSLTLHFYNEAWFEKPPLGFWLGGLAMGILGNSELAIRFLPTLFSFLAVITLYFIGKELFDKKVGFLAGLLLVVSPAFLYDHISRRGDLEGGYLFLFLLSIYFFVCSFKQPKKIIWAAILAALAFMFRGAIAFLLPVIMFTYILLTNSWRHYRSYYLKIIILYLLIILPWHIYEYLLYRQDFIQVYVLKQLFARVNMDFESHAYPWNHYLKFLTWKMGWYLILPAISFLLSIIFYLKKRNRNDLFLAIWLFLAIVPITLMTTKLYWYVIPALPVIALLSVAPGLEILKNKKILTAIFYGLILIFTINFLRLDVRQISRPGKDSIDLIAQDLAKLEPSTKVNLLVYQTGLMAKGHLEPQPNYYLNIKHPAWKTITAISLVDENFCQTNNIKYIITSDQGLKEIPNYEVISSHQDPNHEQRYLLKTGY